MPRPSFVLVPTEGGSSERLTVFTCIFLKGHSTRDSGEVSIALWLTLRRTPDSRNGGRLGSIGIQMSSARLLRITSRPQSPACIMSTPNQSMKPTTPKARQFQSACNDTLRWLISFSLDAEASSSEAILYASKSESACSARNIFRGTLQSFRSAD